MSPPIRERPTVSHLLIHDPKFRKQCWSIIHDPINRGKRFRDIDPGQEIAIAPQTRGILRGKALAAGQEKPNPIQAVRGPVPEPDIGRMHEPDGIPTPNSVKNLSTVLEAYEWFKRAKMQKQPLLVTIGKLASGKIASYLPETQNEAVPRASL